MVLYSPVGLRELELIASTGYPVQVVGARVHEELWVPADELDEFNRHIVGTIDVIES